MVKEKNINIHIHNVIEKRKKRRRRKKGKSKSKYGISNPVQGTAQPVVTSYPHPTNAFGLPLPQNAEAKQYAGDYLIPNKDNAVTIYKKSTPSTPAPAPAPTPQRQTKFILPPPNVRGLGKAKVVGNIDNIKDLKTMSIVDLKKALITRLGGEKLLEEKGQLKGLKKELNKISKENKIDKIEYFLHMYKKQSPQKQEEEEEEEPSIFMKQEPSSGSIIEAFSNDNQAMHTPQLNRTQTQTPYSAISNQSERSMASNMSTRAQDGIDRARANREKIEAHKAKQTQRYDNLNITTKHKSPSKRQSEQEDDA